MARSIFYLIAAVALAAVPTLGSARPSAPPATGDESHALTDNEILSTETIRLTRFKILDINGDGYLSPDEVPKHDSTLRSQFRVLDDNRDGRLSANEYAFFSPSG
jgi:hypothetical protein